MITYEDSLELADQKIGRCSITFSDAFGFAGLQITFCIYALLYRGHWSACLHRLVLVLPRSFRPFRHGVGVAVYQLNRPEH